MRLFLIFISLVVAVAAGIGFWLATSKDPSVVQPVAGAPGVDVQETSILVARRDIPVGHKITAEDLDRQTWPAGLVIPDFVQAGGEGQLIDRVARSNFKERQPLVLSFLANPNDPGFLAAQLEPGKRAVTLSISDVTGISGFVFPGDRVDVIVKHSVGLGKDYRDADETTPPANVGEPATVKRAETAVQLPIASAYNVPVLLSPGKREGQPSLNITEVLVPNVRVLAVGNMTTEQQQGTHSPRTITVEVDELQAQKLRHAPEEALSLALRSLKDGEDATVPRPIADADMSRLIPPSYFPHLYDAGTYKSESVALSEVDYNAVVEEEEEESAPTITIVRGVKKETVGVNRP